MKKLLIIALLVILSSLACEKKEDERRCWTCETFEKSFWYYITDQHKELIHDYYTVNAVCDFDEEGIRLYEISKSDTLFMTGTQGDKRQLNEIITKCH